ncbi:MAG: hypothetical protein CBC53_003030 [Alphaproteobacteria bacterium TMED93]|nr:MAG: hypothetical protein CBC53_003030 [Alphaproteobacteria bacterium TMED93]
MTILKIKTTYIFLFFFSSYLFGEEMIFEDFSKNNSIDSWEFISDQVMGGVSLGKFEILKEKSINFLRMTGKVSLENNGGVIQVRKKFNPTIKKKIKGIKLISRGNETEYYLHLRTKYTMLPWQYYQLKFKVSNTWETTYLNINEFNRSGSLLPKVINSKHIKSIALVAFGRDHDVELDIAEIKLFK